MPSREQLAATRYHLGGSTIGWALGYAAQAPSELWEIKVEGREVEETDEMWFGTYIEPATRALAERYLQRELLFPVLMLREIATVYHAECSEWWAVHPDAVDQISSVVVQLKNHDPRVFKRAYKKPTDGDDNDKVPIAYQMQVLWERAALKSIFGVGSFPNAYLGAYFGGVDLKLYRIGPNAKLLQQMAEKGFAWWKQHLDPNGPQTPPSDAFWAKNRDRLKEVEDSTPKRPPRATKAEILQQPVASLESLA